jgi:hypothetical protein
MREILHQLQDLSDADLARLAREVRAEQDARTAATPFRVGDEVVINDMCGTRYLRGTKCVVTKVNQKTVQVDFVLGPKGRFSGRQIRCPKQIVTKV